MATMATTYSFSSQPKPVSATRKKYREPVEAETTIFRDLKETCIMWDKRVHRGNTHGMRTHGSTGETLQATTDASPKVRRRRQVREASPFDIPLPVPERVPIDLTPNLVAKEEVIEVSAVEAQTDEFLPEPPPEQYQPQKTGIDVSTQVEDGEIFNFDLEAEPILDVLVSKTIEQSIMEVEEEFEVEKMQEFKQNWYKRQEKMMMDWKEQVDEEWVRWEQKEEVMRQKRVEKQREARVLLKLQATAAAKRHLADLVPNAIKDLQENVFPDEQALAINRLFLPELMGLVREEVHHIKEARRAVEEAAALKVRQALEQQGRALKVMRG